MMAFVCSKYFLHLISFCSFINAVVSFQQMILHAVCVCFVGHHQCVEGFGTGGERIRRMVAFGTAEVRILQLYFYLHSSASYKILFGSFVFTDVVF